MDQIDIVPIRRALISVTDKTGLAEFGAALVELGIEILSTGGSAALLRANGVAVTEVSDHTGFPEILDGRVKTLVPQIHGGILHRRDLAGHRAQIDAHGIAPIDLVVVNLYDFAAAVDAGAAFCECIERIDIGGPALLRAAAKNHDFVTVAAAPSAYDGIIEEIRCLGGTRLATRRTLAQAAFARTAAYDAAIAGWFAGQNGDPLTDPLTITGSLRQVLRYGENPHQRAAFYAVDDRRGIGTAHQVQGKELSYNNLADTDAAYECVCEFATPAVVIVKHANPCGVATAATLAEAWRLALRCDPVSAFGGVVAVNRTLDEAAVELILRLFVEVIIAPAATPGALVMLQEKPNIRVLITGGMADPAARGVMVRSVAGGLLVQSRDDAVAPDADLRVVTERAPDARQMADLLFAMQVCKHVKSNAIVFARDLATVGIGAGQMSRVDSARIAAWKCAEATRVAELAESLAIGSVVASDAFFPFADGLQAVIGAGATAVIQPGGSMRDKDVIAAANAAGIAMVFTGMRHFRH